MRCASQSGQQGSGFSSLLRSDLCSSSVKYLLIRLTVFVKFITCDRSDFLSCIISNSHSISYFTDQARSWAPELVTLLGYGGSAPLVLGYVVSVWVRKCRRRRGTWREPILLF